MNSRILVMTAVMVLAAGSILAPDDASARAGGMAVGRAGGFHGGFPRLSTRPPVAIRPAPAPVRPVPVGRVLPAPRPFVNPHVEPRHHVVRPRLDRIGGHRHHDRHRDQDSATVAGVTVYSGSSSYPADDFTSYTYPSRSYVVPSEYTSPVQAAEGSPLQAEASVGGPMVGLRRGCRSEIQMVPSEHGGKTEITVTRCYPAE